MTAKTIESPDARIPLGMRPGRRELGAASVMVNISQAVPEHMRAGTREVSHLQVPLDHRRKHLGTALMNLICQEADANGITLLLTARAYDEAGPDEDQLVDWYMRFGFKLLQDTPLGPMMVRRVHIPNRVQHAVHQALH